MTLDAYLLEVARRLRRFGPLALRPLAEIREHLVDSVQEIVDGGATPEHAEHEAMVRFGSAKDIADQLAVTLRSESDPMERKLKILAIANVFTVVWGVAAVAMLNPTGELLAATGILSAATVAAALASMRRDSEPGTLIISGVALVSVGTAGLLWALIGSRSALGPQIAQALLMCTYCAQGILTMWAGARRQQLVGDEPTAA